MVASTAAVDTPRRSRLPSPAEKPTSSTSAADVRGRRSLHNFSFPPTLSWGNQRVLRCVNLAADCHVPANTNKSSSESDPKPKPKRAEEEAESSSPARPWNLRARRANPNRISTPSPNFNRSKSSSLSPPLPVVLMVERGNLIKLERSEEEEERDRGERCKFEVALKREEIEEDFFKMKGSKPPRRPKKRAKYVQRQLDSLFPGLWLSEITPDLYKIDAEKT